MPDRVDIYGHAWRLLEELIARSRKQSISKTDLVGWQLKALEEAVNLSDLEQRIFKAVDEHGQQEET